MNDDIEIIMSPLCQSFDKDSISLQIEIYRLPDTEWTLEVVNPANTSIVWDGTFESDQAALQEFHRTLATEGIRSFLDDPGDTAG